MANRRKLLLTPKVLKFFVVTSLSSAYVAYIAIAWLKYEKGQVGMSISTQHIDRIELPDISICVLTPSISNGSKVGANDFIVSIMDNEEFFGTVYL